MKYCYVVIFCLLFFGCSTFTSMDKQLTEIVYSDGIDPVEATLLAKNELKNSGKSRNYSSRSALVLRNYLLRKHKGSWFVQFAHKDHKMAFWSYLVVVNRKTGDIQFSGSYVPMEIVDYDWVFSKEKGANQ